MSIHVTLTNKTPLALLNLLDFLSVRHKCLWQGWMGDLLIMRFESGCCRFINWGGTKLNNIFDKLTTTPCLKSPSIFLLGSSPSCVWTVCQYKYCHVLMAFRGPPSKYSLIWVSLTYNFSIKFYNSGNMAHIVSFWRKSGRKLRAEINVLFGQFLSAERALSQSIKAITVLWCSRAENEILNYWCQIGENYDFLLAASEAFYGARKNRPNNAD